LSGNVVTDLVFDDNGKQLLELRKANEQAFSESEYYYVFDDFDASTGFDLFDRLNKHDKEVIDRIGRQVKNMAKRGN
jgi:hypothetical protein